MRVGAAGKAVASTSASALAFAPRRAGATSSAPHANPAATPAHGSDARPPDSAPIAVTSPAAVAAKANPP
jgi:hypothetical protein